LGKITRFNGNRGIVFIRTNYLLYILAYAKIVKKSIIINIKIAPQVWSLIE
jgi:hypothetical protein